MFCRHQSLQVPRCQKQLVYIPQLVVLCSNNCTLSATFFLCTASWLCTNHGFCRHFFTFSDHIFCFAVFVQYGFLNNLSQFRLKSTSYDECVFFMLVFLHSIFLQVCHGNSSPASHVPYISVFFTLCKLSFLRPQTQTVWLTCTEQYVHNFLNGYPILRH